MNSEISPYHNFPFSYSIVVAYDGTDYFGWQKQPESPTIGQTIEEVLGTILPEKPALVGSGRTDAGVHATGQVAHFRLLRSIDLGKTLHSLNSLLPKDIRILKLEEVSPHFHARYSAKGKEYHYFLSSSKVADPFQRRYRLHFERPLNLDLLRKGAAHFLGTHDFTSFANVGSSGAKNGAIRNLYRLDVIEEEAGLRLEFEGSGFLYKMVRNITGTLIEVALGKLSPDAIPGILAAKQRRTAGQPAPAHGLCLVRVLY